MKISTYEENKAYHDAISNEPGLLSSCIVAIPVAIIGVFFNLLNAIFNYREE